MEVAAIEEVTTTTAEPGRPVVGMFDRFKRTIDKKVSQKNRPAPYIVPETSTAQGRGGRIDSGAGSSIIVAATNDCYQSVGLPDLSADFQVYHKVIPGLKTPYDLPIECFPDIEKLLEDGGDVEIINAMLLGPVAASTAAGYKTVVDRFHCYCMERGYTFPNFTKEAVLKFMHDCAAEGAGYAFFSKLMPSLDLLEKVLDVKKEDSALTPLVRCAVEGIKRKKGQERGIVKKATGYSWLIFVDLIQKEVVPHLDNPGRIDAFHFRSLVRAAVIYFTLCRFDDYQRLTDREVTDEGTYIKLIFLRSKNDQFGDNSISVIQERPESPACPVRLIRLYFRRFGLKFGGSGKLLNFRLRKTQGTHEAITTHGVCQSNATDWTRKLLDKHGYDSSNFTEKSNKVQGTTDLLASGEQVAHVMVFGRWRSEHTPLHYRALSIEFRLGVASRFPRF